jgi:hypothetical protein
MVRTVHNVGEEVVYGERELLDNEVRGMGICLICKVAASALG